MEKIMSMSEITKAENQTLETPEVPVVAEFTAPESLPYHFEDVTVGDICDGIFDKPLCQRGYVWDEAREELLKDSMLRGVPIPPIVIGELEQDGKIARLLVDGVQRTTAIANIVKSYDGDELSDYDSAELDYLLGVCVPVKVIRCRSMADLSLLFTRYNNGVALTAVQRGKASLPEDVLVQCNQWTAWGRDTLPARCGNVNADTAGMLLAAAFSAPQNKISTSGAPAIKFLRSLAGGQVAEVPEWASELAERIGGIEDEDYSPAYFFSPSRLCPMFAAIRDTGANVQDVVDVLANWGALQGNKYRVKKLSRSKKAPAVASSRTVSAVFGNVNSGVGANYERYQMFAHLFTKVSVQDGVPVPAKPTVVAEAEKQAAETAEILESLFAE